jgi:hypothetical protein
VDLERPGFAGKLSADDQAAIHNVIGSYAHQWDSGDFDGFSNLFLPDAVADMAIAVLRGREEIRHFHESRLGQFRAADVQRRHMIGSIVIAVGAAANEACISAYAVVFSTQAGSDIKDPQVQAQKNGLMFLENAGTDQGRGV